VLCKLDHENIIKLLGVSTVNQPYYIVMEFCLHGDLKSFLMARRTHRDVVYTSPEYLTRYAIDIASGLEYLHSQDPPVLHRDVALRNCLVDSFYRVKLGDFGLARMTPNYYRMQAPNFVPVRWMPPEAIQYAYFSVKSDIWAFAVLLYEMITFGKFPFYDWSHQRVMAEVARGVTLLAHFPEAANCRLRELVTRCWRYAPEDRPLVSELLHELRDQPPCVAACLDDAPPTQPVLGRDRATVAAMMSGGPGTSGAGGGTCGSLGGGGGGDTWAAVRSLSNVKLNAISLTSVPQWLRSSVQRHRSASDLRAVRIDFQRQQQQQQEAADSQPVASNAMADSIAGRIVPVEPESLCLLSTTRTSASIVGVFALLLALTEAAALHLPTSSTIIGDEPGLLPVYLHRPQRQTYCRFQAQLAQLLFADSLVHPHGPGSGHNAGRFISLCQPEADPELALNASDLPLPLPAPGIGKCISTVASASVKCKTRDELVVVTRLVNSTGQYRSALEWRTTTCYAKWSAAAGVVPYGFSLRVELPPLAGPSLRVCHPSRAGDEAHPIGARPGLQAAPLAPDLLLAAVGENLPARGAALAGVQARGRGVPVEFVIVQQVHAHVRDWVAQHAVGGYVASRVRYELLRYDIFEVPGERLAVQPLAQRHPAGHVTSVGCPGHEVVPADSAADVHEAHGVQSVIVLVPRKRIRMRGPENVAHARTGDELEGAAAHPHPERDLQILAAPDAHAFIVGANFEEVFPIDCEQAASHGGAADRISVLLAPAQLDKESADTLSMMGQSTALRDSLIRASSGSAQPLVASQWLSRKATTSPVAALAPSSLARIRPRRSRLRTTLTTPSGKRGGVLFTTECTVRISEDQASSWKMITTLRVGSPHVVEAPVKADPVAADAVEGLLGEHRVVAKAVLNARADSPDSQARADSSDPEADSPDPEADSPDPEADSSDIETDSPDPEADHLTLKPIHLTLKPIHLTLKPIHLTLKPIHLTLKPIHLTLKPIHLTLKPIHLTLKPIHLTLKPIHLTLKPIHLHDKPRINPSPSHQPSDAVALLARPLAERLGLLVLGEPAQPDLVNIRRHVQLSADRVQLRVATAISGVAAAAAAACILPPARQGNIDVGQTKTGGQGEQPGAAVPTAQAHGSVTV
uniref:Protein kinase domain-containing protein n=1 Tax=Macrostomum lignano TaxID=282301 RepID=A0A1I8GDP3_9PLAT